MKQILIDFWQFIKKPKDIPYTGDSKSFKWKVFFSLFVLKIIFACVYLPLVALLLEYYPLDFAFDDTNYSAITTFLLFVLAVPLVEEVIFRLGLRRKYLIETIFDEKAWHRWFPFFVYSSSIFFGLIHIGNYENTGWLFYAIAPFLVLSQTIGGFILAYLRVKFNFWLGVLFHAMWNFTLFFVVGGIAFLFFTEDTHVKTDTYELTIKEKMFESFSEKKVISYKADDKTVYSIESKDYNMTELFEIIYKDNKEYIPKPATVVELKFEAENGISKDSLLILLEQEEFVRKRK